MVCLLDFLAEKCGMQYLSDLKGTGLWKSVLKNVDASDFPLKDWNEAVNYLYDVKASFRTGEDAKEYLLK